MATKPHSKRVEREMGCCCCCPLGEMLPRALRRRRGRKGYGYGYGASRRRRYYSPPPLPPPYYSHRTPAIGFLNDPVIVVPSDPMHASRNHAPLLVSPSPQADMVQPAAQRSRLRFAPGPDYEEEEGPQPGPVRFQLDYESSAGPSRSREVVVWPADGRPSPGRQHMRWEDGDRRREHFGGEFQYYPNPDGSRITTIFCEENPNACCIT